MIFKIVDGRSCFYQWDIDRQISVSDPTITEVHFCNRTDSCSLVVEVKDGIANVPNKVLQSGYKVRVFGYDGKATLHEATFEVKARTKPADYVYTETELVRYEDLNLRIDAIEENLEGIVVEEVSKYLEENPIDLEGYATEEYVDNAISNNKSCSTHYFNPYTTEWQTGLTPTPASEDLTKFAQKFLAGESVNLFIAYEKNEDIRWLPAEFYVDSNDRIVFRRTLSHGDFGKEIEVQNYLVYYNETRELWTVRKEGGSYIYFYPDKKYVDDAVSNIDVPDVDLTDYYTKTEVDNLLADMPSGGGGLTEEDVQALIDASLNSLGIAEEGEY